MGQGPKLSIPEQINHMKERGVQFNIVSEADARRFLENNTYYFKLKAYGKNYTIYNNGPKKGQYINLEFAYLKDLSTIDARLRRIIVQMSLDLEHFLKVKMLSDFNMVDEDGYEIIRELFRRHPEYVENLEEKTNTSTCGDLVLKHRNNWAIWNIIEIMSFGQFSELYCLFYERNRCFKNAHCDLLKPVKMIRNAAAHNNCLINMLRPPYSREISPSYELRNYVNNAVKPEHIDVAKKLKHPTIHDFITLMYMYSIFVPNPTKEKGLSEVQNLFEKRMPRNADFYVKEQSITSSYQFVLKIIQYMCREHIEVDKPALV